MKKIIFFLLLILTITMTLTCVMSVKHEQNVNSLLSLTINRSLKERYKLYQTETDILLYNTKDNLLMLADMVSTFVNVEPISGQLVIKDSLIKIEN